MPDIRGFFAPKRKAQSVAGTEDETPSKREKLETSQAEEVPTTQAQPTAASSKTPSPSTDVEASSATPTSGLSEEQQRRIEMNLAAAQAKRNAQTDPVGLIETMACVSSDWRTALAPELSKPYFRSLMRFLRNEYSTRTILPPAPKALTALQLCPLSKIRVVILGQDPYFSHPDQANGLAFSVSKNVQIPPSLRNMIKEAVQDVGIPQPRHGALECWARQGVLLLNTVLTVRHGTANSHQKKGWEHFTDAIIKKVNRECDGVVFLLWGKPAQKKMSFIHSSRHTVIKSSHPSPLSAGRKTKDCGAFLGSKCYSKVNAILRERGEQEIDWAIV